MLRVRAFSRTAVGYLQIIREFGVSEHWGHWKYEPDRDVKVRGFWFEHLSDHECHTIHGCI